MRCIGMRAMKDRLCDGAWWRFCRQMSRYWFRSGVSTYVTSHCRNYLPSGRTISRPAWSHCGFLVTMYRKFQLSSPMCGRKTAIQPQAAAAAVTPPTRSGSAAQRHGSRTQATRLRQRQWSGGRAIFHTSETTRLELKIKNHLHTSRTDHTISV